MNYNLTPEFMDELTHIYTEFGIPREFDLVAFEKKFYREKWFPFCDWNADPRSWNPNYAIYDDPDYLKLVFSSFSWSQRMGLKTLEFFDDLNHTPKSIIDVYGGSGQSSALLARGLPNTTVYYYNDCENQVKTAKKIFDHFGLKNVVHIDKLVPAEAVFLSELIEHFLEPWEFYRSVLDQVEPKYVFEHSTYKMFEIEGAGHFPKYIHRGQVVPCKKISRKVTSEMRRIGYYQCQNRKNFVHDRFYNGYPTVYVKKDLTKYDELTKREANQ